MNLRTAVATCLVALALTGCGDTDTTDAADTDRANQTSDTGSEPGPDSGPDSGSDGGPDTGTADAMGAPMADTDSPAATYVAFRDAIERDDLATATELVRADFWSDLDSDGGTLEERLAAMSAQVAEGTLVLPAAPDEVVLGAKKVGVPKSYLAEAKADDVAVLVFDGADAASDSPGDVRLILLREDSRWLLFGIEPAR